MIRKLFAVSAIAAATLVLPVVAQAQGVPGGIERGARDGERAAGPVGAIVGDSIGYSIGRRFGMSLFERLGRRFPKHFGPGHVALAKQFFEFLQSPMGQKILEENGYAKPNGGNI